MFARARGPEVDPPGQSGCGMRCMGAWLARGTRKGVQERSAVPQSGQRVGDEPRVIIGVESFIRRIKAVVLTVG